MAKAFKGARTVGRLAALGIAALIVGLVCLEADAQTLEWTWMSGGNGAGGIGVYGTLGSPAAGNGPGGREFASSWTDSKGNLWLFGGYGYDSIGSYGAGYLNDLWEFTPSAGQWAWMSGSNTRSQKGEYGTLGTPAAGNTPGSRWTANSWTDSSGNLWLFGGSGYDSAGNSGYLNDLWEFNPSTGEWAWMGGSNTNTAAAKAVYGTLGTPAPGNIPAGREDASNWTDSSGNFWLFGGLGYDSNSNGGYLNDLWEFNPSTGEWTWMSGSNTVNHAGVYGTLGTPASGNVPGTRISASSWTDSSGNLWLFGGTGYDSAGQVGDLNDLWEFNPSLGSHGEWTWMSGSNTVNHAGVYGTLGAPAAGNVPGGRQALISWTDSSGNGWLFGGDGYDSAGNSGFLDDLWEFNPSLGSYGEWAWMSGSNVLGGVGTYGTLGTPAAANVPGGRWGASSWRDSNGNLWLFGGDGLPNSLAYGLLNDLWKYQLNAPVVATPTINWGPLAAITYGTTLGSGQFNASASSGATNISSDGTFTYYVTSVSGTVATSSTVLPGGSDTLCVQWTPSSEYSSEYNPASLCVPITVNAASTSINWNPSSTTIVASTGPTSGQFDAVAYFVETNISADGTFTYYLSVVGGTQVTVGTTTLPLGADTICVQWSPSSSYSADYNSSSTCQSFTVINTQPTTTSLAANTNPVFLSNSVTFTATVIPTSGTIVPTGWVAFYDGSTSIGTGTLSASGSGASAVAKLTTTSLAAGSHSITAKYPGDTNNQASQTTTALVEVVEDFSVAANAPTSSTIEPGTTATFAFTVSPVSPATTFPAAIALTASGLPTGATATLSPTSIAAGAGSTTVTLTVTTPITTLTRNLPPGRAPDNWPLMAVALLLLPLAGRFRRTGRRLGRMLSLLLLLAAGITAAAALDGCGGVPTGYFGQAPATSTITVTGTSGSLSHSASVSLTVE